METNKFENVVDRLEETFDFDRDTDLLSQLYFSTSYDCGGRGIVFGDVVLFCTVDDGEEYKPCENTICESEFCNCSDCETNCQEWAEDDIYNTCVARLKILGNALLLKKDIK